MKPYPTRQGIAIPTSEVYLPETRLNQNNPNNFNTHHLEFYRRAMGRFTLTQTLRDLASMQESLPKDIHNIGKYNLHTIYGPPVFPKPEEAMERVSMAYEAGEGLAIWNEALKIYEPKPFTEMLYKAIKQEYERLK